MGGGGGGGGGGEAALQKNVFRHFGPHFGLSTKEGPEPGRLPWGPFLESPDNFSGPKSNIQIEIKRLIAQVLASKILHFVSLTDSFIMLDAKLLKFLSCMQTTTALRAR